MGYFRRHLTVKDVHVLSYNVDIPSKSNWLNLINLKFFLYCILLGPAYVLMHFNLFMSACFQTCKPYKVAISCVNVATIYCFLKGMSSIYMFYVVYFKLDMRFCIQNVIYVFYHMISCTTNIKHLCVLFMYFCYYVVRITVHLMS